MSESHSEFRRPPAAWHPILFAMYPVLAFYTSNAGEVDFARTLPWLAASMAVAGIVWLGFYLPLRSGPRSAIAASTAVWVIWGYGLVGTVRDWIERHSPIDANRVESVLLILGLLSGYWVFRQLRSAGFVLSLTRFLNAVSAILLLFIGTSLVAQLARSFDLAQSLQESDRPEATYADASALPDIYLIILDAYAGEDILRDFYGYDNEPFLSELRDMGFHVQASARSNFPMTLLSLSTLLNLRYSIFEEEEAPVRPVDWRRTTREVARLTDMIKDSEVVRTLRSAGYEIVVFESGFEITEIPGADLYLRPENTWREFDFELINQTVFAPIVRSSEFAREQIYGSQFRNRVLFTLDEISRIPARHGPKFVFAHIPSPHRPIVFHADGSPRAPDTESEVRRTFLKSYPDQLHYLNTLVLKAVGTIRERSPDAVIVLQGDHGPKYIRARELYSREDLIREYLSTLNALCLPDSEIAEIPPAFSQANTFRIVFNEVLGMDYPLLADVSYFSSDENSGTFEPIVWEGARPSPAAGGN